MSVAEASLDPIILIEDEQVLLDLYVNLLEERIPEYELLPFSLGSDGLKAICEIKPSLIITDLRLPEADGLQILSEAVKRYPDIPIVVISGFFGLDQVKQAVSDTANITFISKPFDSNIFGSFVETLLSTQADSTINGISLFNIVQMIGADRKSCYLELIDGDQSGVVSFTKGQIQFARTGQCRGIDAVLEISKWKNPIILIFNDRKTSKVNIQDMDTQALLLKIAHYLDQSETPASE